MATVYNGALKTSLQKFGLSNEQAAEFFDLHSQAMLNCADEILPFSIVRDALIEGSFDWAIITSSYSEAVYKILNKGLEKNFELPPERVYGREMRLPKSEKIRKALKVYACAPSQAIYIGDLVSDVLYCRDVSINVACVGYGYHPPNTLRDFIQTCFSKLKKISHSTCGGLLRVKLLSSKNHLI